MVSQPRIVTFPANTFVELDEPLSGKRNLVYVGNSGTEYLDFLDTSNPATPLDILDVLSPVAWGDYRSLSDNLMLRGDWDGYKSLSSFLLAIVETPAACDNLTMNRAVHWAVQSGDYNAYRASLAALQITQDARVRQSNLSAMADTLTALGAF